jgi:hypothetical protein
MKSKAIEDLGNEDLQLPSQSKLLDQTEPDKRPKWLCRRKLLKRYL